MPRVVKPITPLIQLGETHACITANHKDSDEYFRKHWGAHSCFKELHGPGPCLVIPRFKLMTFLTISRGNWNFDKMNVEYGGVAEAWAEVAKAIGGGWVDPENP